MKYLFCLLTLLLTMLGAPAARAEDYLAGVARADITPDGPIWLSGYGNRNKPSEGVEQPLFVKALAISHGSSAPLLLIAADIIGFPRVVADAITDRIERDLKIPRANMILAASHTHTGPVIGVNLRGMFELTGKDAEAVQRFTKNLQDKCVEVAVEAVKKRVPARLSFARSKAGFAVNRRVFRANGVNFGVNPEGPVDHEVPVLRVDNPDGAVRAIVFGYACHCTTLTGDYYRITGDWTGYAQDFLERAYPGATALFVTGCGADANPEPRGKLEHAKQHGLEMAGAVSQALKGPRTSIIGPLKAVFERVELPLAKPPTRDELQQKLQSPDRFVQRHARRQLEILDKQGKLPATQSCPVQMWQLGKELTLVTLGGEVVVDYALRIKREIKGNNVWVGAYCNDVFAYVPSVRILLEGGYEADYNLLFYGLPTRFSNEVEGVLIDKIHELVKRVRLEGS